MSKNSQANNGEHVWRVQVRSAGHLDYWIADYFGGLAIIHELDGSSTLKGDLPDMPAVYGLILQLRDAGIFLLSLKVDRMQCNP